MNNSDPMLSLSAIENIERSSKVKTTTHPFEDIVTFLSEDGHPVLDDKIQAPAFNFSRYQRNRRRKDSIVDVSAAVLDLDNLPVDKLALVRQSIQSFKSLCHTTYSHTSKAPRLRIIVPFHSPVSPPSYADYVRRLAQFLDVQYDPVSENPNTLYFMPSRPESNPDDHFIDVHVDAEFLDFDTLPPAQPRVASKTSAGTDSDERNYYDLAAEAQAAMYSNGLTFVNGEFYAYSGGIWAPVSVLAMQKAFSRKGSQLHDVLTSPATMRSLIDALRAHAHLDEFPDATPMTVCVLNGVVNLNTGKLRTHAANNWHRNRLEIEYREDATCPRWLKFVEEVFELDQDKEEKTLFLQEFMGYLLVPSNKHQIMLWCIGEGANGKSVAIEVMQALLGTENYATVPLHTFGQAFRNAVLLGKLANFCSEISGTHRVNEGAIKEIVGGDAVYAEKKGKDGFSFKPYARIVATGNTLPELSDTSDGFSRRLAILTFNRRFAEHEREHDLHEKLLDELPGIFVWAIQGLRRLNRTGKFTRVSSSVQAVTEYKLDSNPVAQFMNTVATKSTQPSRIKTTDLYESYSKFCKANGYTNVKSDSQFGNELRRMGITVQKSGNNRYYRPVEWRSVTPTTPPVKKVSLADELSLEDDEKTEFRDVETEA
ncbi:phage/plasmid primase, P4 family [Burkholderia sp. AU38729]|uniref:DNA primase family protein n=1 Tax=Burkholderia sp. AU38729 TaxID=2879633 RepID=UPI001CF1413C|nr:phage/plasmid primase, P4 family [Burkholderia sp. AU38729]MCA8067410.1 phage/plasmid primase, P4 family [Burkholderia sp. AU38729]